MSKEQNPKRYDLEDRTYKFARRVTDFVTQLPNSLSNHEYGKQLLRSAGSVAANYIEANESLGKKDFLMHVKICRKESKESRLWLRLLHCQEPSTKDQGSLIQESVELMKIFGSIVTKSQ
ncbi:MAG: four helix bundle protein [Bacteroidota bacterium]